MSDIYENDTDESTEESVVDKRAPRDVDERKDDTRPNDAFIPQSLLPIPEPQDGWVFRWIRTSILGESDNINVSTRFREGWEPVKAEEAPHIVSDNDEKFEGNITQGGLMLCKAPKELIEERTAYYEQQTKGQIESVDNNLMRENDPRMPLFHERKTKVTFGSGG